MTNITFITGNLNKVKYTNKFTHYQFKHQNLDLDEIQSLDLVRVAGSKAKQAYEVIKSPVLVEDTSLVFLALGDLPGTFIKFFLEEMGNDAICKMLNSFDNRGAVATVCYALFDGKHLETFIGKSEGSISTIPRGENGHGWDPIFVPKGCNKTHAEMTDAEMEQVSPRKKALIELEKYLDKYSVSSIRS